MRYLVIDSDFIELSKFQKDLSKLFLEINDNGAIKKELGLSEQNKVIHVFPSSRFKFGKYGIFDLNQFDLSSLEDDITYEEFYEYWNKLSK